MKATLPTKYRLYETSVQDTKEDVILFNRIYRELRKGKRAHKLREDFCGTHMLSCDWVKANSKNSALALDIDREPLAYGEKTHQSKLSAAQSKRLTIQRRDVRSTTNPTVDIVTALNFSYWVFKERDMMKRYFKHIFRSLKSDGLFICDAMGGWETMEETTDREKFNLGRKKYTYIWSQEAFNPISHEGFFSISFGLPNGKKMKRAFTYDWRLWSLPEIKDIMHDAGFKNVYFYWEGDDGKGSGNGEFSRVTNEENSEVWIAFIVASKK